MSISRKVKDGSMRHVINGIFTILRSDDELMRLLHCTPDEIYDCEDIVRFVKDDNGDEVIDEYEAYEHEGRQHEGYWDIVNNHIVIGEKSTNIEEEAVVRLYIHPGRRRPVHRSYTLSKQEVVIDVFVHESFATDMRLEWINDRINELLSLEHVEGAIGKLDYVQGNDWVAPIGYVKYQHMFVFGANKK